MDRSAHRAPGGQSTRDSDHLSVKVAEGVPGGAPGDGCVDAMSDCCAKPRTKSQLNVPIYAGQDLQAYIPPQIPAYRPGDRSRGHLRGVSEGGAVSRYTAYLVDSSVSRPTSRPMSNHIGLSTHCFGSSGEDRPSHGDVDSRRRVYMSTYEGTAKDCSIGKLTYSFVSFGKWCCRGISAQLAMHAAVTEPIYKCARLPDHCVGGTLVWSPLTVSVSVLHGVPTNYLIGSATHHQPQLCSSLATGLSHCCHATRFSHCSGCSRDGFHANLATHQAHNILVFKPSGECTYKPISNAVNCLANGSPNCEHNLYVSLRSDTETRSPMYCQTNLSRGGAVRSAHHCRRSTGQHRPIYFFASGRVRSCTNF